MWKIRKQQERGQENGQKKTKKRTTKDGKWTEEKEVKEPGKKRIETKEKKKGK